MLLRHSFGLNVEAAAIEKAVTGAIAAGARTPDIVAPGAKPYSTREVGDAILGRLSH
jgi:3-isopropylmalate dehydrogenase